MGIAVPKMTKLWGARFDRGTDELFEAFSSSYAWDVRLLPYDLKIDAAHVKALRKCGVLTGKEAARLLAAIRKLERLNAQGKLHPPAGAEDVHSALQGALKKEAGDVADKIHTGRSRNDLVAQSSRLYCLDHIDEIISRVAKLQKAVVHKAEEYAGVLVPGMTHLQNAQAVSQGHIFLAYAEMLERVQLRLAGARVLCDVCVLGSGALAGSTFALDQKAMARELGLSTVTRNSYDVAGDRDYVLNFLSSMTLLSYELSRMAEDLLIAQTKGFALVDVDQAFCTGSSMMPQKKNADFLELLRGSTSVFAGNFIGFAAVLKGLPTSYNRDLQWDKKFLFDSVECCETVLELTTRMFRTLKIRAERAKEMVLDESLYATDYADYLVQRGVSFREAHSQVGRIVRFAEEKGVPISKIGLDLLRRFSPKTEGDVYELFNAGHSVRMKKTLGSTHPAQIAKQISFWKKKLK